MFLLYKKNLKNKKAICEINSTFYCKLDFLFYFIVFIFVIFLNSFFVFTYLFFTNTNLKEIKHRRPSRNLLFI